MNKEEGYIKGFFARFGLVAEKIPESNEESPDFLVEIGSETVLIELKTKIENDDLQEHREKAFDEDQPFSKETVIARSNAVSKRIRKASRQLIAQKNRHNADYCFVFLLADGFYLSEQIGIFETTLYGDKDIIPMGDDFDTGIKKCFYYSNSDFFNHRDIIDGAFVLGGEFGRLCINSLSHSYNSVIRSSFVQIFRPGVLDPVELESRGKAMIMDSPIDRSDDKALNRYLCKKYGIGKVVPFNWPQITVTSRIRIDE